MSPRMEWEGRHLELWDFRLKVLLPGRSPCQDPPFLITPVRGGGSGTEPDGSESW